MVVGIKKNNKIIIYRSVHIEVHTLQIILFPSLSRMSTAFTDKREGSCTNLIWQLNQLSKDHNQQQCYYY